MVPDQQDIFFVLIVSGGAGAGEFIYDAAGNLRSSNVGQVTTDPVQGITCQQGFSTYNGHGAVINLLSTSQGAFLQYQDLGTSTQGSLILAVASVAGTDPVTAHAYGAGLTGIDPVFGDSLTAIGATISLILPSFTANAIVTANTGSGVTSPFVSVAGPEQAHAGHAVFRVYGVSADGTKVQGAIISGTDPPVRSTQAMLEVQGLAAPADPIIMAVANAAGNLSFGIRVSGDTNPRFQIDSNGNMHWGPGNAGVDIDLYRGSSTLLQTDNGLNVLAQILCGTYLDHTGIATPAAPAAGHARRFSDTTGFPRALAGLAGDTDTYGSARLLQQVSPRSQTITNVASQNITGLSKAVGIGTYIVRGRLIIEWNFNSGTPGIRFAGPAVSQMDVSFKSQQSGTSSTANDNNLVSAAAGNGTGYNGTFVNATGAMTATGIFFDMDFWGMFTFTAAGTLTLQGAAVGALVSWIVLSGFWEVLPL